MDWEKKTAQRAPLQHAAADTFNDMIIPGQAFLQSLQAAEVVRKEAFFSTVSAKMKAAREKLPSLGVKHAPRSDTTIFTKAPQAEVNMLLPNVRPAKGSMVGVQRMLDAKLERHRQEWEKFVKIEDDAKRELEVAVATCAAEMRERLALDDEDIEMLMLSLAEDRVMNLTEAEVVEVWDAVAHRIPERARWIRELGASLEEREEARRAKVEKALVDLVQGLTEVAVFSEGQVERLLEDHALELNTAILANRCAYADLVKRLQVAEVELERERRQRWEAALVSWRTLRSRHAMHLFKTRIQSPEFAEPPARMRLFEHLRAWQQRTATRAKQHVEGITGILPPHMTAKRVAQWKEEAEHMVTAWNSDIQAWRDKLQSQDDTLEAQGWDVYNKLVDEVLQYKGYPEEEVHTMLDQECGSELRSRREAAQKLCVQAIEYLQWQATTWQHLMAAVAVWLADLTALYEEHKAVTSENEGSVRAMLKAHRDQYNAEDAAREAALEAAIAAVRQGSSETKLDQQVAAALVCLEEVEAGYRTFATSMAQIVRTFPQAINQSNDKYHWNLCTKMLIKPLVPDPNPPPPPEPEPPVAPPEPAPPASTPAKPAKGAKATAPAPPSPVPEPEPAPPPEPEPEPAPIKTLELPDGSNFDVMRDLLTFLLQQAQEHVKDQQAVDPAVTIPVPATSTPSPEPSPTLPEAAKATKKGAAAPVAPTPPPAELPALPEPPAAPPVPSSPLTLNGKPHCSAMPLPEKNFQEVLEHMQVGLLKEMIEFAARTSSTADQWAEERETAIMEELDAHLRAHRPRAGRIEEETRLARSVELVAQRRKIEGHLRLQSKAVKGQAAQFEEWATDISSKVGKQISKLRAYDMFLGQALSGRAIDIRKREAEALRAKLERELDAQLATVDSQVTASCARITAANAAFSQAELKTFAQGGSYNQSNVYQYQSSLDAIDEHIHSTQASQLARLQELKTQLLQQADEAIAYVTELIPSHHEDMALIEQLERLLEAARRKARTDLSRNTEASAAIDAELCRLEAVLASSAAHSKKAVEALKRPPRRSGSRSKLPGRSTSRSRLMSQCGPATATGTSTSTDAARRRDTSGRGALSQCNAILSSMDALREQLYRQAKTLDFLRSSGLVIQPLDLTLDAAPEPEEDMDNLSRDNSLELRPSGSLQTPTAGVTFRPGPRGQTPDQGANTAGKGGAQDSKQAGSKGSRPTTPDPSSKQCGEPVSLAKDIQEVIDACKRETEAAARTYYQMLFPPDTGKGGAKGAAAKAAPAAKPPSASKKPAATKTSRPTTPAPEGPQPIRPIRYPSRIPPALKLCLPRQMRCWTD